MINLTMLSNIIYVKNKDYRLIKMKKKGALKSFKHNNLCKVKNKII